MKNVGSWLRGMLAGGIAVLALAGAVGPASAASKPGWRVAQTFGPAEGSWSQQFAVTGAKGAWSTWYACVICGGANPTTQFLVERSTGGAWSQVAVPPALGLDPASVVALGASSANDAWLFNGYAKGGTAFHWTGSAWSSVTVPSWVVRANLSGSYSVTPVVFGPQSVWVFSEGQDAFTNPSHYAARFDGTTWTQIQLPGIPASVVALSPSDMWATGISPADVGKANPPELLMHWNGSTWSTLSVPLPKVPAGTYEYAGNLVALGPAEVWLTLNKQAGVSGAKTAFLLHWKNKKWSQVKLGLATSIVDFMASDGHGGIWLASNGPAPKYAWYFDHFNGGHWTRTLVPPLKGDTVGGVTGLTWIPGTQSVWAAGEEFIPKQAKGILGTIFKYGP